MLLPGIKLISRHYQRKYIALLFLSFSPLATEREEQTSVRSRGAPSTGRAWPADLVRRPAALPELAQGWPHVAPLSHLAVALRRPTRSRALSPGDPAAAWGPRGARGSCRARRSLFFSPDLASARYEEEIVFPLTSATTWLLQACVLHVPCRPVAQWPSIKLIHFILIWSCRLSI